MQKQRKSKQLKLPVKRGRLVRLLAVVLTVINLAACATPAASSAATGGENCRYQVRFRKLQAAKLEKAQ